MSVLASLSDDQFALVGCGVALLVSVGLMSLSYVFGAARQADQQADTVRFGSQEAGHQEHEDSKRHAA